MKSEFAASIPNERAETRVARPAPVREARFWSVTLRARLKLSLPYLLFASISVVVVFFVMQLWRADLKIPFYYEMRDQTKPADTVDPNGSGDAFFAFAVTKGIKDNGWMMHNPFIGAPSGMDLNDYPLLDTIHFCGQKAIGWFTSSFGVMVNIFFLIGFPLTTVTALYTCRQLKIETSIAGAVSLLYAFLPYHFLRGEQHLALASYYLVPLTVLLCFWAAETETLFPFATGKGRFPVLCTNRGIASLVISVLVGCGGVYYAAFGVFFLAAGCLFRRPGLKSWFPSGILAGVIMLTVAANLVPTWMYRFQHGANPEAIPRSAGDAETFGLKIIQLLLPVLHHRLEPFASFASYYAAQAPLFNENVTSSLGLIASAGFLLLLAWHFGFRLKTGNDAALNELSQLNICGVLLATVGSFGSLLAFGISPLIRCYNRISIYIAFFSFLAVALVFQKLRSKISNSLDERIAWGMGLVMLVAIGLADQTTASFVPLYAANAASFQSDERFVRRIESSVPKGAMIFQLPYAPFPEGDYQLFRGYLHSRDLRWSFGAMRGRPGDLWMRKTLVGRNMDQVVKDLVHAGFQGIYIDRLYIPPNGSVERAIAKAVKSPPIQSENQRLVFYKFGSPAQNLAGN